MVRASLWAAFVSFFTMSFSITMVVGSSSFFFFFFLGTSIELSEEEEGVNDTGFFFSNRSYL